MRNTKRTLVTLLLGAALTLSSVPAVSATANTTFDISTTSALAQPAATAAGDASVSVEPVYMDFTSTAAMERTGVGFGDFTDIEEGIFETVDGEGLELKYAPYASWKPFRSMIKFTEKNMVTENHKYARLTYKIVDSAAGTITLMNNANGQTVTAASNTIESSGEYVVGEVFDISGAGILTRLVNGSHFTLLYSGTDMNAKVFIKELAFFGSEAEAYAAYGEDMGDSSVKYSALTFGSGGNGAVLSGDVYGVNSMNDLDSTLDITWAAKTNLHNSGYMAKVKFANAGEYSPDNIFMRVLYSAKNPEGIDSVSFYLVHDGMGDTVRVASDVRNTNGEFVLSDVSQMGVNMPARFAGGMHCSLIANTAAQGAEYRIKAIYFFPTKADAEAFVPEISSKNMTINGNDIANYTIVVSENASLIEKGAAGMIQKQIRDLTGIAIPIVDDSTAKSDYEILVGTSNRELSHKYLDELQAKQFAETRFVYNVDGNTLAVNSQIRSGIGDAVDAMLRSIMCLGIKNIPDTVEIKDGTAYDGKVVAFVPYSWPSKKNVSDPVRFTENFTIDNGYFTEESAQDNWKYKNGEYTVKADEAALSYVHVYESNASLTAKWRYTDAGENGDSGLMLRYNSADAYLKAGYDFAAGEWYITSCEGKDFNVKHLASKKATVAPDTWYELKLVSDGTNAYFYVNGTEMLRTNMASHISPGRIGVYAQDVTVYIDDAEIVLLSGEGTIMKDIAHTKLTDDVYFEGGSAWEMSDGSLIYQHYSGITYKSPDNGVTWEKTTKWTDTYGYPNIMRLNNGDFMKIASVGGNWISQTSSDDGKTWVNGGVICSTKYPGTSVGAGNMNDKLMQSSENSKWPNRIFYGQNYEGSGIPGKNVFCEFYYSDDNGRTWQKSDTASWDIVGNEKTSYFGECKLLECADGTVRMYNSWSSHGYITYSDSKDGGKTFGPLQFMMDFPTSRSSMQFVRDRYADNDTTYYMVWINNPTDGPNSGMPRSRLSLAKSTDGKTWERLGDIWRWESAYKYNGSHVNHIVDPFIKVTEDYIICGSGFSEHIQQTTESGPGGHNAQRQHIYSIKKSSLGTGENLGSFTDVSTKDVYYDAVKFVTEKGLFNGTSAATFSPATSMTRSMFVTVLGRLDGADVAAYTKPTFSDVTAGQWYTSYVEWAAASGIVNGIGNGLYGINGNVTVEQVCVILARYAGNKAASASGVTIADFADASDISAWAQDGVKWAVENGVYTGNGDILDPTAPASRALVAEILMNYVTVYGE